METLLNQAFVGDWNLVWSFQHHYAIDLTVEQLRNREKTIKIGAISVHFNN